MTTYATINPTTGHTLHTFPIMSDAEVKDALAQATDGYREWRQTAILERASLLSHIAELHRERLREMAELITLEMGKPIAQAKGEVELSASIYEYYATKGPQLLADEELDVAGVGRALVRTASIGPLLGVMPWNYPYYQVARLVAPNLLLGNTVLLKHAGNCPQAALRIHELIEASGAPRGVYQNAFASTQQIADMIADPRVRGVSLTGSERAGSAVGALAGKYMKKAVLELGGSDPFLVLPDADVAGAVAAAVPGRFANAGQACTSSKRLIIHADVWDSFLDQFLEASTQWQLGDPMNEGTRLGPMASKAGRDELAAQVEDAVSKGASVHLGGLVPEGPGAFYPATVISGVTRDMRAYHEELFGPVAVLHRAESIDAAVELANDSPYGLGSAVFTQDASVAQRVVDLLEVGMVGINTTIRSAPELPFGGIKNSGIGRELGRYGLDEFANKKLVRTV